MVIGQRIRQLREMKKLSQGDIEESYGSAALLHFARRKRPHGPFARNAGAIRGSSRRSLYQLFCEDGDTPKTPNLTPRKTIEELAKEEGEAGSEDRFLAKIAQVSERLMATDRRILLALAKKLATRVP